MWLIVHLLLFRNLWIYGIDDLLNLSILAWTTVNRFCSLKLWLWRGNRDLWFELNRHFFPNDRQSFSRQASSVSRLDSSSGDIYPLYSRPSVTLRQVFCTCSSEQVLLTVSVECKTTQAYTCRQHIIDIKVLSKSWVDIPTYFNLHSKDIREYAFFSLLWSI